MIRALAAALALALFAAVPAAAQPVVSYTKPGAKFADVRDDLKTAIESRGLVVDYESHVNRMLERTAKDLGATKKLYVDAQALQFCSAALSRKMMEADPSNMVMCPYAVVVYATVQQPDRVVVSYRRPLRPEASPASAAALREVDALLDGIAREAVGLK